jgi:hypothetical protein
MSQNPITPIVFSMPAEEHPEPGAPSAIEHGCDYLLLPDGELEFHYNFLIYRWQIGTELIEGRTYLDGNQREISLFVPGLQLQLRADLQAIVRFLQRRFLLIKSFHQDDANAQGYSLVFRHQRLRDDEI